MERAALRLMMEGGRILHNTFTGLCEVSVCSLSCRSFSEGGCVLCSLKIHLEPLRVAGYMSLFASFSSIVNVAHSSRSFSNIMFVIPKPWATLFIAAQIESITDRISFGDTP